jgi:hypothetical protein
MLGAGHGNALNFQIILEVSLIATTLTGHPERNLFGRKITPPCRSVDLQHHLLQADRQTTPHRIGAALLRGLHAQRAGACGQDLDGVSASIATVRPAAVYATFPSWHRTQLYLSHGDTG